MNARARENRHYFSPNPWIGGRPGTGSGRGANARTSEAAENRGNACPDAALEGEYASGSAADGVALVEEHAAEPVAAGEGDAGGQASTAARMCTLPGAGQFRALPPSQCKIDLGNNQCPRFPRFPRFLTGKVSFSGKAREPLVITQGAISLANGSRALPEKDTFPVRKAPQRKPLRGNFEGAEGPGIAPHPAACAFAPLCLPARPPARPRPLPLPLQCVAPLRVLPLARTDRGGSACKLSLKR
jgi:hypothetical protein